MNEVTRTSGLKCNHLSAWSSSQAPFYGRCLPLSAGGAAWKPLDIPVSFLFSYRSSYLPVHLHIVAVSPVQISTSGTNLDTITGDKHKVRDTYVPRYRVEKPRHSHPKTTSNIPRALSKFRCLWCPHGEENRISTDAPPGQPGEQLESQKGEKGASFHISDALSKANESPGRKANTIPHCIDYGHFRPGSLISVGVTLLRVLHKRIGWWKQGGLSP